MHVDKYFPHVIRASQYTSTYVFFLKKTQESIALNSDRSRTKCDIEPLRQWTGPSDLPAVNPAFSGSMNKYIYAGTSSGWHTSPMIV